MSRLINRARSRSVNMASSRYTSMCFEQAKIDAMAFCKITYELKPEQNDILKSICSGIALGEQPHLFALLPTGFGKSDIFGLFPQIMNTMSGAHATKAVVISPLRSLMIDQVSYIWLMGNFKSVELLCLTIICRGRLISLFGDLDIFRRLFNFAVFLVK